MPAAAHGLSGCGRWRRCPAPTTTGSTKPATGGSWRATGPCRRAATAPASAWTGRPGASPRRRPTSVPEHGEDPSNILDHGYPVGAVNLCGQTPIVLVNDGPSTGGFINPYTVPSAAFWKLAQSRPGDIYRFRAVYRGRGAGSGAAPSTASSRNRASRRSDPTPPHAQSLVMPRSMPGLVSPRYRGHPRALPRRDERPAWIDVDSPPAGRRRIDRGPRTAPRFAPGSTDRPRSREVTVHARATGRVRKQGAASMPSSIIVDGVGRPLRGVPVARHHAERSAAASSS